MTTGDTLVKKMFSMVSRAFYFYGGAIFFFCLLLQAAVHHPISDGQIAVALAMIWVALVQILYKMG